jgi:glyceraldehyde-3-phosphate dehydrogenase (NAD(P))
MKITFVALLAKQSTNLLSIDGSIKSSYIINTLVPEAHIPSHQGPDAQKVIPELNIFTIAARGPYNLSHIHFAMIELKGIGTKDDMIKAFEGASGIALVEAQDGILAPNCLIELMRDVDRPRADLWEVEVRSDILDVKNTEAFLIYRVQN